MAWQDKARAHNIYMAHSLWEQLKEMAGKRGTSPSQMVSELIRREYRRFITKEEA